MNEGEKVLTYEEAKRLCRMAFDAGADYGSTSTQFNCNAVAYDWEHWLKKNVRLFMPKPTVEDVLREFALTVCKDDALTIRRDVVDEYAAKLQLRAES